MALPRRLTCCLLVALQASSSEAILARFAPEADAVSAKDAGIDAGVAQGASRSLQLDIEVLEAQYDQLSRQRSTILEAPSWCRNKTNLTWAVRKANQEAAAAKKWALKKAAELRAANETLPFWIESVYENETKVGFLKWALARATQLRAAAGEIPQWLSDAAEVEAKAGRRWAACKAVQLKANGEKVPGWMEQQSQEAIKEAKESLTAVADADTEESDDAKALKALRTAIDSAKKMQEEVSQWENSWDAVRRNSYENWRKVYAEEQAQYTEKVNAAKESVNAAKTAYEVAKKAAKDEKAMEDDLDVEEMTKEIEWDQQADTFQLDEATRVGASLKQEFKSLEQEASGFVIRANATKGSAYWCKSKASLTWAIRKANLEASQAKKWALNRAKELTAANETLPPWIQKVSDVERQKGFLKWASERAAHMHKEGEEIPKWLQDAADSEAKAGRRWAACKAIDKRATGEIVPAWMEQQSDQAIKEAFEEPLSKDEQMLWTALKTSKGMAADIVRFEESWDGSGKSAYTKSERAELMQQYQAKVEDTREAIKRFKAVLEYAREQAKARVLSEAEQRKIDADMERKQNEELKHAEEEYAQGIRASPGLKLDVEALEKESQQLLLGRITPLAAPHWCRDKANLTWMVRKANMEAANAKKWALKKAAELKAANETLPGWIQQVYDNETKKGFLKWAVQKDASMKEGNESVPGWLKDVAAQEASAGRRWAACKSVELKGRGETVPKWMEEQSLQALKEAALEATTEDDSEEAPIFQNMQTAIKEASTAQREVEKFENTKVDTDKMSKLERTTYFGKYVALIQTCSYKEGVARDALFKAKAAREVEKTKARDPLDAAAVDAEETAKEEGDDSLAAAGSTQAEADVANAWKKAMDAARELAEAKQAVVDAQSETMKAEEALEYETDLARKQERETNLAAKREIQEKAEEVARKKEAYSNEVAAEEAAAKKKVVKMHRRREDKMVKLGASGRSDIPESTAAVAVEQSSASPMAISCVGAVVWVSAIFCF